jgi:DNA-binding NarL/FixJ family response regulator
VGASIAEIHAFPAQVVRSPTPVIHCIIDQHLDDPEGDQQSALGTDIAKQLRTSGCTGRCIMRSANDSPASLALYHKCGADAFMSKSPLSPAAFVEALS